MIKQVWIFAALALAVGSASAGESTTAGQKQSSSTVVDSTAVAGANNAGNSQNITFTSPTTTSATVNQTVNGTQTLNQNVSGTTTQNVNSNISGTQTVNQNQTVSGTTTQNINYGDQTIKNTPSVNGGNLTSSNDTCMGSASGSANVPGIGLSFGKTYTDDNCVMLKNSRELWNMGMKAASMALMCMDKNNRAALEMTGFKCPQSK